MGIKQSTIFDNPKADDTSFKPSLSAYANEATITPTVKVYHGINGAKTTRVSDDAGNYLRWELIGHAHTVEITPSDYQAKEVITIAAKPKSNTFELAVSTNLTEHLIDVVEDFNNLSIITPDDPVPIFGYQRKTFRKDGENVFLWGELLITDSNGDVTFGLYQENNDSGNSIFTIGQEWLDNAVYPIFIDPTTTAISAAGINPGGTTLGGRGAAYNGTEYLVAYDSGSVPKCYTSSDPTSSWTDESASLGFTGSALQLVSVVAFSNGDILICGKNNGSSARLRCQLRAQNGTWGSIVDVSTAVGKQGSDWSNISVVADENDNVFWLDLPRADGGGFYRQLALFKSNQSDVTSWSVMAHPMGALGLADKNWFYTGSCWGMVADGDDHLQIFAREDAAGAAYIYTQQYTISTDTYDNTGTSIAGTASVGSPNDFLGMTVMSDSNGAFHIWYTTNNLDSSSGNGVYATNRTGSWAFTAISNFPVGTGMITDDDTVIFIRQVDDTSVGSGVMKLFIAGSLDSSPVWFTGYQGFSQPHLGGVDGLYQGEPYWVLLNDRSTDTRFGQNTDHDYSAGGDITPPTGVATTYPTAALEGVSICPTITCSAGSDDTPPISYYFQVDTVNTFDSANLQESGWQSADTSWVPSTQLTTETTYYTRVKARDAVVPPNEGSYAATITFTTGWQWPGLTQPTIVYGATTVAIPVPVKCRLDSQIADNINVALDKSIEVVNLGYPADMSVTIEPIWDATFKTAIELWFDSYAGQGKAFTFTSGQNARYDGVWWLKDTEFRPKITRGGGRSYQFTFKRVYD